LELADFEKRKQTDKTFEEDVRLFSQANDVIREASRLRMKKRLDDLGKQHQSITMVESFLRYRLTTRTWLAVAAMIAVIAIISVVLFTKQYDSVDSIYSLNYSKPGAGLLAMRSGNENTIETTWQSALVNYDQNNFAEAGLKISNLLSDTAFTHISAAHFILGICYLNLNKPDSAAFQFQKVSTESSFAGDAQWYLGLSYLKAGNTEKAAGIFKSLKSSDSEQLRKASRKVLRMMKRV
jgi:tetratricopeptide (TPR) repeat protein